MVITLGPDLESALNNLARKRALPPSFSPSTLCASDF